MTIEMIKVKFFEAEVEKLLDFFPELKEKDFLLFSGKDARRQTFFETFPLISDSESEIISIKKSETSGSFEFGIKGSVILFRNALPSDSELKLLDVM